MYLKCMNFDLRLICINIYIIYMGWFKKKFRMENLSGYLVFYFDVYDW